METQLFDIQLNDQGRFFLDRMQFWAKFFYACTLITCVIDFIIAGLSLRWLKYFDTASSLVKFRFNIGLVFLVFFSILAPIQGYLFYRFASKSKKAIYTEDFNNSFKWLLQQAIVASALFAINSLWTIVEMVIEIKTPVR